KSLLTCFYFFVFQAEDGIRDDLVTGVQTCALPICTALSLPKILESAKERGALWCRRLFFRAQLQARFRRKWRKRAAALATDRAFCGRIFHLLEAAVRAFRTDFYKRRIGHWTLSQGPFFIRALQRLP